MSAINWPSYFPAPLVTSGAYKDVASFVRTEMADGLPRQRRRYTTTPTLFDVSFLFTIADAAVFEFFFNDTLAGGAEWFNMFLQVGAGFVEHEVRFIDTPQAAPEAGNLYMRYTASIETLEKQRATYTTDQLAVFDALGGPSNTLEMFDAMNYTVNTQLKLGAA